MSAENTEKVTMLPCLGCGRDVMDWSYHYKNTDTDELACPECYEETFAEGRD